MRRLGALAGLCPPLLLVACSAGAGAEKAAEATHVAADVCEPQMLEQPAESGLDRARLCIGEGEQAHAFVVELARSAAEQSRGLMFRDHVAPDAGMLFPFDPPREAAFWMRNTYIPLDMVFITPDGRIESILADVEPRTLDPRRSQGRVSAVLELAGGRAAELGLAPGDRVGWPR